VARANATARLAGLLLLAVGYRGLRRRSGEGERPPQNTRPAQAEAIFKDWFGWR
jgi:hypothetical protein